MRTIPSRLLAAALLLVAAGCRPQPAATPTPSASPTGSPGAMMEKTSVTVTVAAQNNSGQSGTATLDATADGKTSVKVNLTPGPAGVPQPAHIHLGACPAPGAVRYPLTSLQAGQSETVLAVALTTVLQQLPLAINVHKSADELPAYVACGDITAGGTTMKKADSAMMKKDSTEDDAIEAELQAESSVNLDAEINAMEQEINAE